MKRGPQQKEKKTLSAAGLFRKVKESFLEIPNQRKERNISLVDCLMSGLAVFSLKYPSLLSFDDSMVEPLILKNTQTLFQVENVPCDTYMREVLDEINPRDLRKSFVSIFHEAQRGKLPERYEYLGGYLVLVDGTEIFHSEKVHCKNCCEKHHEGGKVTYHHQLLGGVIAHPNLSQVIPLCPEPILKKDGAKKNDCERNALSRFLVDLKKEHPRLSVTIVADALSATAPNIHELREQDYDFIIVAKKEGNKTLFEWVKGVTREVKMTVGKNRYTFRYINKVPVNGTENAPLVNFLECEWIEVKGRKEIHGSCAWITSHKIHDENVYDIMRGGRCRWKVENETFNTLKNQGYQFEHNFGHGKKNLHTIFALLMMPAFLIDQIQEATCGLFQSALKVMKRRVRFWEKIRGFFSFCEIGSWTSLYEAIKNLYKFRGMKLDTS